jgi:hypothetical protein
MPDLLVVSAERTLWLDCLLELAHRFGRVSHHARCFQNDGSLLIGQPLRELPDAS